MSKVSEIFGKPREGVHSYRICDIAMVDLVGTVVICYIVSNYFKLNFWLIVIIALVLAETLHLMLGVDTTVARYIKSIL